MASDVTLTDVEQRENAYLELTGTPGAVRTLDMFDTNERVLTVFNNCDSQVTIRNSASGGSGQPVIAPGTTVTFHYDGLDFLEGSRLSASANIGFIPMSLTSARYIDGDDIPDGHSNASSDSSGGLLAVDTTPALTRVATSTDKALRILWLVNDVDEVQFAPIPMPPDLDDSKDVIVHLLARMDDTNDTPTINVEAFDGIGDTEMGGVTAALSDTLAELTRTLVAANISGHPLGFLNISLIPGAHTTDDIELYAIWLEYTKK